MHKVAVIGSGFSSLSAACCLAKEGLGVTVFEKNDSYGGRARKFESDGFMFDMGPSWYWMPDVFESFFNHFNKSTTDYYSLVKLDPSYRIFFSKDEVLDVPSGVPALVKMFEDIEPGSGKQLEKFLKEGKYKYEIGINELVYKPGLSISELFDLKLMTGALKLHVFQSVSTYVRKHFKNPKIQQLLEFPVLFLGATPQNTPALYTLMNYADMALGTWYPMGGMYKIIEAMTVLAKELGVEFKPNSAVTEISMNGVKAKGIVANATFNPFDAIVAGADYEHVEQTLLPKPFRKYSDDYWQNRVLAPSCLIFYLGVNKRLKKLLHHNLFFDQDFGLHAKEIYENPAWPTNPLFYVCCPSKTDSSVAPDGMENLFILMPVAPGLHDTEEVREKYFDLLMNRLESLTQQPIKENIIFKRSYAHNDFIVDYNAYKGNAYGLANTLKQTANLKPSIINKKVNNLFYTGQLTVPGPGVPPSLISGRVTAAQVLKKLTANL